MSTYFEIVDITEPVTELLEIRLDTLDDAIREGRWWAEHLGRMSENIRVRERHTETPNFYETHKL